MERFTEQAKTLVRVCLPLFLEEQIGLKRVTSQNQTSHSVIPVLLRVSRYSFLSQIALGMQGGGTAFSTLDDFSLEHQGNPMFATQNHPSISNSFDCFLRSSRVQERSVTVPILKSPGRLGNSRMSQNGVAKRRSKLVDLDFWDVPY